jgi:hypothetical protein
LRANISVHLTSVSLRFSPAGDFIVRGQESKLTTKKLIIAAIIGPVLVGILLLNVEYSFFVPGNDVSKKAKDVVDSIISSSENTHKKPEYELEELLEPDVTELKTLHDIASEINVSSIRNVEFSRLVGIALDDNKPAYGAYIASSINVSSTRNDQYIKVIETALKLDKYAIALAVVKKINVSSIRNAQYQKIINAGIAKKQKSTNR